MLGGGISMFVCKYLILLKASVLRQPRMEGGGVKVHHRTVCHVDIV